MMQSGSSVAAFAISRYLAVQSRPFVFLDDDAFSESRNWYARTYLAINQGPIVIMMAGRHRIDRGLRKTDARALKREG